jgi:predicted kinase
MSKLHLNRPTIITLYGFPGSGKSFFGRQLAEELGAAHVQGDRIRYELFETPRYDKQENQVVNHLMEYMAEEFLRAGISVVFDTNAARAAYRHQLRGMARRAKAQHVLIWLQIDIESSFLRVVKRDRRKADDKYAAPLDRAAFDDQVGQMQNPVQTEDYIVISGKHTFNTQRSAVAKKLYDMGLLTAADTSSSMVKPELVNLVPQPIRGRTDLTRRNIFIR